MSYIGNKPGVVALPQGAVVGTTDTQTLTNKTLDAATNSLTGTQANLTSGYANAGPDSSAFAFRNKIIGGDFTTNPWQRGTSFTGLSSISAYGADRWLYSVSNDGAVSVLKTADAPTVAQAGVYSTHCLHIDVTTADAAIAAGQYAGVLQRIEGFNAAPFGFGQSGTRYVTLSFWHKHTKTGTYCVALGNSAGNRSYVAEYTQAVTDTWELATVIIPVDTSGTWLYDSGIGVSVAFQMATGSTYQTAANTWASGLYLATANQVNALDNTANNFKIALVQLEPGSVATPFEARPVGYEQSLCQRYYYRTIPVALARFACGFANSTTQAKIYMQFPVPMRIAPAALEQSGTAGDYAVEIIGTAVTCNAVPAFTDATPHGVGVNLTVASGLTAGNGGFGRYVNTSGYLGWSAEL